MVAETLKNSSSLWVKNTPTDKNKETSLAVIIVPKATDEERSSASVSALIVTKDASSASIPTVNKNIDSGLLQGVGKIRI